MLGCQTKTASPLDFFYLLIFNDLKGFFLLIWIILGNVRNPSYYRLQRFLVRNKAFNIRAFMPISINNLCWPVKKFHKF